MIEGLVTEKEIGEDDGERALKEVEEAIQRGVAEVDHIVGRKEKDILEV